MATPKKKSTEKKSIPKSFTDEYAGILKKPLGKLSKLKEKHINKKYSK